MTNKQVEGLLRLLSSHGVTRFKNTEVEIELGAVATSPPTPTPPPPSQSPNPGPSRPPNEPLAAVPPTEASIPHHVNEVASLLKLGDNELVEKMWPLPPGIEG